MERETADTEEFLELRQRILLIDVRAPGEFTQGHIPGAQNLPLFDDEERAQVGTTYKQRGRREAIRLGLDLIGPKMRRLVDAVEELFDTHPSAEDSREVLIYCARGGMRSDSMSWLLRQADFSPLRLLGGYKRYRQYGHEYLARDWDLVALTGMTGSGKTRLLQELEGAGEQIVDLEGMANHRGSAFGGIGQDPQPSTEHFENLIFERLLSCDRSRRIWIEDESRSVGKCVVPQTFFDQLHSAPAVSVDVDWHERAAFLVDEYGQLPADEMIAAIERIRKRLGGQHVNAAIDALNNGELKKCAEILLVYYDKTYEICRSKNPRAHVVHADVSGCDREERLARVKDASQVSLRGAS